MWLIAGLGNPGARYQLNRHNVGFLAADLIAEQNNESFKKAFGGLYCKSSIVGSSAIIIKPQSFMNNSGLPIKQCCDFYKVSADKLIVIHDDLDVDFPQIKIKYDGGHGGHNGLRSIIQHLGADFIRIRMGVGRPKTRGSEADFVLSNYSQDQNNDLHRQIENCHEAIKMIIGHSLADAQQYFNAKPQ